MNRETVKPLILIFALIACIITEHLPFGSAILLSVVHFGALAICGEIICRLAGLAVSPKICDRIVVNYLLGWCLVPVVALMACIFGSIGAGIGFSIAVCAAIIFFPRVKHPKAPIIELDSIPVSLYIIAGVFTIISVAVPFSCFSGSSILREFYGDAVQRFGVINALSEHIPPSNPFFAGAPLRYYWLWMLPYAAELKYICSDLFTVWKCGQTWTALCFPLGLWYLLRRLLNNRNIAYIAVLFTLIFASYEIFAHPILLQKTASVFGIRYNIPAGAEKTVDPDFTIGVLQPYSDQLLTEDFLYIPQNTYAIIIVLVSVIALTAGRVGFGSLILSTLMGINAFFAPPAFAACLITCVSLYGFRSGLSALSALAAGSSIWMAICGIISLQQALLMAAISALTGLLVSINRKTETAGSVSERSVKAWAIAMLVSFACIIALSPLHNTAALALAYSPSILFGIYYLLVIAKKRNTEPPIIIFLLVFCTIHALVTVFISFQQIANAPDWLHNAAVQLGKEINLFNFYHKSGKMVRLAWAVLGAMGVAALLPYLKETVQKWPYLVVVGTACLLLSMITPMIRPFTYLGHIPVAESDAAAYLKTTSTSPIVLLEDFRTSEISELVPVKVFYYSQWSNGNSGLNALSGTWADQYLPVQMRHFSLDREKQVVEFFTSENNEYREAFLARNSIDFILTRQRYNFTDLAVVVVDKPGGYLYRVAR